MGLYDYKNHETTYSALDVVNYSLPAKFLLYNSIHYMSPDPSRASRLNGCGYARLVLRVQSLSAHANEPPVARVKYSILLLVENSNLHRALKYYSVTTHSKKKWREKNDYC